MMKFKTLLLAIVLSIVCGSSNYRALADTATTGDGRVIENPTSNGDLKLRVNVGGVKTDALTITGSTAKVNLLGGAVFTGGGSTLSNYCAGNFTVTFTNGGTNGITTSLTDTWYYVRIGDSVTVQTGSNKSFTKSSSTGTIFLTGAPACILPTTEVAATPVPCTVNGAPGMVNMHVDNSVFILFRTLAEDTFAANTSGNVLIRGSFNYVVR